MADAVGGLSFHWSNVGGIWPKIRTKQLTRTILVGKLGRTIFSLSPIIGDKNFENLWTSNSGQRGHFVESKV